MEVYISSDGLVLWFVGIEKTGVQILYYRTAPADRQIRGGCVRLSVFHVVLSLMHIDLGKQIYSDERPMQEPVNL